MANEIWMSHDSGKTVYALIWRVSDKYIYKATGAVFEAVGTWDDSRVGECDIPMTESGDSYFADFPAVSPGTYNVQIREQAGASPDADDEPIGQGVMYWAGTSEDNVGTIASSQNRVIFKYDETIKEPEATVIIE